MAAGYRDGESSVPSCVRSLCTEAAKAARSKSDCICICMQWALVRQSLRDLGTKFELQSVNNAMAM